MKKKFNNFLAKFFNFHVTFVTIYFKNDGKREFLEKFQKRWKFNHFLLTKKIKNLLTHFGPTKWKICMRGTLQTHRIAIKYCKSNFLHEKIIFWKFCGDWLRNESSIKTNVRKMYGKWHLNYFKTAEVPEDVDRMSWKKIGVDSKHISINWR